MTLRYTLYSLAMGCRVTVVEPVPLYQRILRLGLSLNPGFGSRTVIYSNVAYPRPGEFNVSVPLLSSHKSGGSETAQEGQEEGRHEREGRGDAWRVRQGMAGMVGDRGVLKREQGKSHATVRTRAISIDEICDADAHKCNDVCALKVRTSVHRTAQICFATIVAPRVAAPKVVDGVAL